MSIPAILVNWGQSWRLMLGSVLLFLLVPAPMMAGVSGKIVVYPKNSSIEIDHLIIHKVPGKQFTAYVPISPSAIQWRVNGIAGGSATFGTISATGLYVPPAKIPVPNAVIISAQSKFYRTSIGSATLKITRNVPNLWSINPSELQTGNYLVTFNGSNFAPDSVATANGMDVATTYVSPTSLIAKGRAVAGTIKFRVRQPGPGEVTSNQVSVQVVPTIVTVSVSPVTAAVSLGKSQTFTATVTGNSNSAVTWSVNGMTGGSSTFGTISATGTYTAPATLPVPATLSIKATSMANPSSSAQATMTITTPPPAVATVTVAPATVSVTFGKTQTFTATVANTTNTAVTWSVNDVTGGSAATGTITASGIYTAPESPPSSSSNTVTIRAVSVENSTASGQATALLNAAPTGPAWLTGARFLEQSSFGPNSATLAQVKQLGINAYLEQQFTLPETPVFVPVGNSMGDLQKWVLYNYTSAPDQLRQRVAYSLGQIIVTSANKLIYADEIIPAMRLLSKHAFGNYRTLLREMSVSPSMGKYLDLANSRRPGLSGGANENYARELMQLFTIGLWRLNQDGSLMLDPATQQPLPTYNQQTVAQVALALTGWTYAVAPGATPRMSGNHESFAAPMIPAPGNHDSSQKNILGVILPGGQTVDQDLDSVLDILFNHPNTAPFIATRLIRSLVTSNPSPAYITRIANVFDNNGAGVRGDLKSIVTAILLDPEARNDTPAVNGGRLKEPILQISNLLRALNGGYTATQQVTYIYNHLGQMPIGPPSVFNWFSPLYHMPRSSLFGPEFQIYTPSEATLRGNFMHWLLTQSGNTATFDLSPFQPYGNDMPGLVEAVNQVLLYGRMEPAMKQILIDAAKPGYDAKTRIMTVLYLTALSGQYAVQY